MQNNSNFESTLDIKSPSVPLSSTFNSYRYQTALDMDLANIRTILQQQETELLFFFVQFPYVSMAS